MTCTPPCPFAHAIITETMPVWTANSPDRSGQPSEQAQYNISPIGTMMSRPAMPKLRL